MKRNWAAIYQEAIKAIAEIRDTQVSEGSGNYSRDLYPFRAILDACANTEQATDESLAVIANALSEHRAYPRRFPQEAS
jgi:hypothetical protein